MGLLLAGCGGMSHSSTTTQTTTARIQLSSPAFARGGTIPRQYTCDGTDTSLPLRWSGIPTGAQQLALVMRDPDAPGGNFIHWSLSNIPPSLTGLAAGHVPAGVTQSQNGFGTAGYRGPCPPRGAGAHHYVITLSALAGRSVVASGTLTGTYARP